MSKVELKTMKNLNIPKNELDKVSPLCTRAVEKLVEDLTDVVKDWINVMSSFREGLRQQDKILKNVYQEDKRATITLTVEVNKRDIPVMLNLDNIDGAILVLKTIFELFEGEKP